MISLTRAEYWLLESVVLHGVRLSLIFAETFGSHGHEGVSSEFNKPSHGLDSRELLQTLLQMQEKGWVAFEENLQSTDESRTVWCSESNLVNGLRDDCRPPLPPCWLSYQLTPRGGEIWEQFAAADWSWFVTVLPHSRGDTCFDSICVTALSKERLQDALPLLRSVSKQPHGVLDYQFPADDDLMTWEAISPWHATYWKQLPVAQTVSWSVAESWLEEHQIDDYPRRGVYPRDFLSRWYRWR